MAASLHQFKCFLTTVEQGSFTKAATELGISQPALSEQVRLLERSLHAPLFTRVGRGVVPTEAGDALLPHALAVVSAVDSGQRAVSAISQAKSGSARFGLFGAAHLYIAADLIAEVSERFPGLHVGLVGQNSSDVIADIRRGRLEAGLVALPVASDEKLSIHPVAQDEVVYLSADPDHVTSAVTSAQLAESTLVLSEATWGDRDYTRQQLVRSVQADGLSLRPRLEVENVETAMEIAARGYADTIAARGVHRRMEESLPAALHAASFQTPIYDAFAVVYREGAPLTHATRFIMNRAEQLMQDACARARPSST